jgi:hypothetical protein
MNLLGAALTWLSVTITVLSATALILERAAARRGPRAGSWVAAVSLLLFIILTPLASCPVPTLVTWRERGFHGRSVQAVRGGSLAAQESGPADGLSDAGPVGSDSVGRGVFSWKSLSQRVLTGISWGTDSIRQRHAALPPAWCVVVVAGTCCCLIRLLFGLWGVRECRRKSIAICDPDTLALVDSLRIALGVRASIEVRELPGLGLQTAAALGWLHPLVLLPGDWRSWTASERRAVLAHEVAHIARADYAVGVVARLGLALYFYHPLVHWLVGRLQLHQELAADADGARLAGGRRVYLLALTRLALGIENSRRAWPAITFLPTKGQLIRRIHVLKEQFPANDGTMPAPARAITILLLIAIGVGAAALRSPSAIHGAEAPPGSNKDIPSPTPVVPNTPYAQPLDLSYLPSTAVGFVAFRPAAIGQNPACRSKFEKLNAMLATELPAGMPKIESIEQATIEFRVLPRDKSKNQQGRLITGALMLRTVDDFDWLSAAKAVLKKLDKTDFNLVEVHLAGKIYYKATRSQFPRPLGPDSFYFPDARTIVWDYENNLRKLICQVKRTGPDFVAGEDWGKVDKGLVALALDTRDQRFKLDVNTDEPDDLPIAPILQLGYRWVLGIDSADSLNLHAIAKCGTDAAGHLLAQKTESFLARARVALGQMKTAPRTKNQEDILEGEILLADEFVRTSTVNREGLAVHVNATSHSNVDSLITLFLGGL